MRKLLLPILAALALAACESTSVAYGEYNGIVAAMDPALWEQTSAELYAALEPTIVTVRDEKTFTVTYQDPSLPEWRDLRRFRQLLLVGTGDEPWMREALDEVAGEVSGPGRYSAEDVWARGQHVTLILVSAASAAADLRSHLPEVNRTLDAQFRAWVVERMFTTGVDSALADTLLAAGRFELFVPEVYRWSRRDSLYQFRNDNPDPSELIRNISVTWKSPIPPDMQPEGILAWRAEVAAAYAEPQDADLSAVDAGPFRYRGQPAYQIRAVWLNPPEVGWPAAGPFITRAVICLSQNRMYLLDAWLYAPAMDKYEYVIQLETILDSFRCGPA
ncbi:MAG: DUF4837 family protein [Gemmatimonadetes bacterium]|nr:DUF4837 family protein [Gemmatimonadota bacterium]